MDKVDFSNNPAAFLNSSTYSGVKAETKKTGKKSGLRESRTVEFSEVLERSAVDLPLEDIAPSEEAVQELLDAVRGAGDELRQRPVPDEILKYKRAIRNFFHYILRNGYAVEVQEGVPKPSPKGPRWDKQAKVFHVVRVVDQKLDRLAVEILAGQVSKLELLAKLEEITGLLVDLIS
jgi:uncharacterized protein YaaR (DUF327 family)